MPSLDKFTFFIFYSIMLCHCESGKSYVGRNERLWDEEVGYCMFSLGPGRFGNQVSHLISMLRICKQLGRVIVLPDISSASKTLNYVPLQPFDDIFDLSKIREFHRAIPMATFMNQFADQYWPEDKRVAFCKYSPGRGKENDCRLHGGYIIHFSLQMDSEATKSAANEISAFQNGIVKLLADNNPPIKILPAQIDVTIQDSSINVQMNDVPSALAHLIKYSLSDEKHLPAFRQEILNVALNPGILDRSVMKFTKNPKVVKRPNSIHTDQVMYFEQHQIKTPENYTYNTNAELNDISPEHHPVLLFLGRKSIPWPMPRKVDETIHGYLDWVPRILTIVSSFIDQHLPRPFVAIHARLAEDWKILCEKGVGKRQHFCSAQCGLMKGTKITQNVCYPSQEHIVSLVNNVVDKFGAKSVFVGTSEYTKELHAYFMTSITVPVVHYKSAVSAVYDDARFIDLAIMEEADHFIGNCISSFTACAARRRTIKGKSNIFFGVEEANSQRHGEL